MIGVIFYGVAVFVLVMFYRALARIGEELSEIKEVLRERLPPPGGPGGA